jgi:hypothetical protein
MTTAAWLTMILTMGIVTAFSAYFFWRVLNTPNKTDSENQ